VSQTLANRAGRVTATRSTLQVEDDLHCLAQELPRRMGRLEVSVLAVGSVGRAHQEANSAAPPQIADYDLILVVNQLSEVERLYYRRRIDRWLRTAGPSFRVPVSVGILRRSAFPTLPFTLFNYEMRYGYRVLAGSDPIIHMPLYRVKEMPLIEATRLLLNRGVPLWGDSVSVRPVASFDSESAMARRCQKALMAIGDALMIADGVYDWSYSGRLVNALRCNAFDAFGRDLRSRYMNALESRLGRGSSWENSQPGEDASALLRVHAAVLRFVEERRLGHTFSRWDDYMKGALQYPHYLRPSWLKSLAHMVRAFGPPRGNGFYRRHFWQAPEEILLRAFPCFAYSAEGAGGWNRALNWSPPERPAPVALWERFQHAWVRAS
jgi:hypothetical protein